MSKSIVRRVAVFDLSRKLSKEQRIVLGHLTYSASKLWNVANYTFREESVPLKDLCSHLKTHFWYKNLHSQSAQAVIQKLEAAWRGHFKRPAGPDNRPPGYQPKDGHFPVKWKKAGFKFVNKGGDMFVRLSLSRQTKDYLKERHGIESDYLWVEMPKSLPFDPGTVQEIEIVPHRFAGDGEIYYVMHVIYRKEIRIEATEGKPRKWMAIDPGVVNLATCVVKGVPDILIVSGRMALSMLRWWNKERARLQSVYARQGFKGSKRLSGLSRWRRNFMRDFMHKAVKEVLEFALNAGVTDIAVGDLSRRVADSDIGHVNNQKLHQLPLGKFVDVLEYKARELGIRVHRNVDEHRTSETCSVCGDYRPANRIKRGLWRCKSCGTVLNADVNAARNILWKVSLSPVRDRASGFGRPRRIRVPRAPASA